MTKIETQEKQETWGRKAYKALLNQVAIAKDIAPVFDSDIWMASSNNGLLLWPTNENSEEGLACARKVYGWLKAHGWVPLAHEKKNIGQSEYMEVVFSKGSWNIILHGWMAKSCRIVTEEVVIPAKPATEATPERTEIRKRIVCENE